MNYQIEVNGQNVDVWTRSGRVENVTLRSSTKTWTTGGGGYISAQYGGWVAAPQMRSQTTEFKELRLLSESDNRQTISFGGDITCIAGDNISLVYVSPSGAESGSLAGIVNHTERRWWSYPVANLVSYRRERIVGYMVMAPLVALFLTMTVGRYVDWRISSITTERAELQKGITDWDDFRVYNETHRPNIPVKTFAALHRPSMDYSWTFSQYMDRFYYLGSKLTDLRGASYQIWPIVGGIIAFLVAWFAYVTRGQEVEAISASRLKAELEAIASSRSNQATIAVCEPAPLSA
jgi:hypothetical protein